MVLKTDIAELIAAAAQCLRIRTRTLADEALATAVLTACEQAGNDLQPEQLTATISAYALEMRVIEATVHDLGLLHFSIRSVETDHWVNRYDFLITGLRDLVIEARRVTKEMPVLSDLATIYVLIGYAIRVGRDRQAA